MSHRHRRTTASGAVGVVVVLVLAGFLFATNTRIVGGARGPQDLPGLVQAQLDRAGGAQRDVARRRAGVGALT
ncbi:MAG TPA: DUF881 domain-containing protein, partial [Actinotalea sp.]|nr:DUF881 domain-containing protein [Actinotalea sp.]